MDRAIIECVPNFSEGCNLATLDKIAISIAKVEGVKLLNIDRGEGANRTVFTFIGEPNSVCNAAFDAIKCAVEHIDMSQHMGSHPRIGAADVVPFIPIKGISLEQVAELAQRLSERVARELNVSVYCYGAAAKSPNRENLASCRKGEYEGIEQKLMNPEWIPDYGVDKFSDTHVRSGISVIGARDFLVAINFNLASNDVEKAKEIAKKIRYSGYIEDGVRIEGALPGVKAIGWYIPEFGFAQVSMNIVDIDIMSIDRVWNTLCAIAATYQVEVTGTEVIAIIPERVLLDAARGFGFEADKIDMMEQVAEKMNFSQLTPFKIEEKVLEYVTPIKF